MPTYIWKQKTEKKGERDQKDRKRKDSRKISTEKVLKVKKGIQKSKVGEDTSI